MRDTGRFYTLLSPERFKAVEEVLEQRDLTLEGFKLMRKDYSNVKNNVKRIEKKLHTIAERVGHDDSICKWVVREIASIENKYKDIEFAIKHYNVAMRSFNSTLDSPYLLDFDPNEKHRGPVRSLKGSLSLADMRINNALDAIRITKRYFKNISSAFEWHVKLTEGRKQMEQRVRMNELKLMKEQGQGEDKPELNKGAGE